MIRFFFQRFLPKKPFLLEPLEAYDIWSESYTNEKNPVKQLSDKAILNNLPSLKNKHVLDFGCGAGFFCKIAEDQLASSVRGIDISPKMIAKAESESGCKKAIFTVLTTPTLPIQDSTIDVVISGLVFGHIDNIDVTLNEIFRVLKPEGFLIFTDFHWVAAKSGMKRTFHAGKKTYEIKHTIYSQEKYLQLLKNSGFKNPSFQQYSWNETPVILTAKFQKLIL